MAESEQKVNKATNITWHSSKVTPEMRSQNMGQKGATIWLTGLSGSGKSTVAMALEKLLLERGRHAYCLDGDNIRHGLNKNLGFSPEDRTENIRRIGEVTKLFADSGMIAINSFISPYRADRDLVRAAHKASNLPFFEVFVKCPLEEAEKRDPKGLYKKARLGEIKNFTGIDDPYEEPLVAELVLNTHQQSVEECALALLKMLEENGII